MLQRIGDREETFRHPEWVDVTFSLLPGSFTRTERDVNLLHSLFHVQFVHQAQKYCSEEAGGRQWNNLPGYHSNNKEINGDPVF